MIFIKMNFVFTLKSLSLHLTNVNSSYGLSPFIDYKKLWKENEIVIMLKINSKAPFLN